MEYKKKKVKPIQSKANNKSNKKSAALEDNRSSSLLQRKLFEETKAQTIQKMEEKNNTGLPNHLKSGVENLSGQSLDDVKVHYNSSKPAQINALAYAQGNEIHLGSGQEKHLPHEAWHVAQQKQGKVKPTTQLKDEIPINDDEKLEEEADKMGSKADKLEES